MSRRDDSIFHQYLPGSESGHRLQLLQRLTLAAESQMLNAILTTIADIVVVTIRVVTLLAVVVSHVASLRIFSMSSPAFCVICSFSSTADRYNGRNMLFTVDFIFVVVVVAIVVASSTRLPLA